MLDKVLRGKIYIVSISMPFKIYSSCLSNKISGWQVSKVSVELLHSLFFIYFIYKQPTFFISHKRLFIKNTACCVRHLII